MAKIGEGVRKEQKEERGREGIEGGGGPAWKKGRKNGGR